MAVTANELEAERSDAKPHRLDFATFVRLGDLGIYPARAELIDGIVYDMSPKGDAHYLAQTKIVEQFILGSRERYDAGAEPTLRVDELNGPMPDVLVMPRDAPIAPERASLVIEIAESSLEYDRTKKRALYALAGVAEYWVVDLQHELVERYLPSGAGAPSILRAGDELAPEAFPDVRIDLATVFGAARRGREKGGERA